MLGDNGVNAPEHWIGGLASPDLHAIVILFARDDAEHDRCVSEHEKLVANCPGVEVLSVLDLHAIPPLTTLTIILATGTDCRSRPSRGMAKSRRPAPAIP